MARCKGCPKCQAMSCCGCRHGFAPSDTLQSHHICDERGPCDGLGNLPTPRTDSERYAELRKLVEAWQTAYRQNDKAQTKNNPITEVWLKHWLNLCDAQKPLLDWRHR